MKRTLLIFLAFILVPTSCYYIDSERYEAEITSTYSPKTLITSNLDDLDSIVVVDSLFFNYTIDIDTGKFYFADLYIGNYKIFRSDSLSDSLWIYPFFISQPGDYILTLAAYYKTYTESLADILNAEFFLADTSWTLTINRLN